MITDEEVEAGMQARYGTYYATHSHPENVEIWRQRMRATLEAAEAVRPRMVEVAGIQENELGQKDICYSQDRIQSLPIGTKLYAEQPRMPPIETPYGTISSELADTGDC